MKTIILLLLFSITINAQTLTHDNQNRITNVTYANNTQITYIYDAVGNRTSQVITGVNNGSLPVEITDFSVTKNNCETALAWITQSETNVDRFEVQHSLDAINYESIHKEQAVGNSTTKQYYKTKHSSPAPQENYYRLKTIDTDGTFELTKIKAADFKECEVIDLVLYPNPTFYGSTTIEVESTVKVVTIEVYNALGQLIIIPVTPVRGNQKFNLDTGSLVSGIYDIRIHFEGGTSITKQLTIAE